VDVPQLFISALSTKKPRKNEALILNLTNN